MFENKWNTILQVKSSPSPQNLLNLKIRMCKEENNMSVFLSQQATTAELIHTTGLTDISTTTKPRPYRSDYPVDKIKCDERDLPQHVKLKL